MKKNDFFDRTKMESEKQIGRRTFFSFAGFSIAAATGVLGWKWLNRQPQIEGALQPLRKTLEGNEKLLTSTFSERHLVKTYPIEKAAKDVRKNGTDGLQNHIDGNTWRLNVKKTDGSLVAFNLDEIKKLPKQEIVYDFKCVEGWSQIQHWGGVSLRDFMNAKQLNEETKMKFIGMQTPNGEYYVGLDMPSALHPQTILAYEMNGQPLTMAHGFPLRLIVPVKYGIKNLKCIGLLFFSNTKPRDYWAERGYDYYAGL
ncbi:MAG: molybdopterin-dependent oxidoreductase [Bacteroidota bacterium]|nr:molybdopterin-dependent oxidoreductase [Bacteroidota bacterium]